MSLKVLLPFAVLTQLIAVGTVCAQSFRGNLAGTLVDPAGASVTQAIVRVQSGSTGLSRQTVPTSGGDFLFADLPLGKYEITVTSPGFQSVTVKDVEVAVSRTANVPIQLSIAQQASSVEVQASTIQIETTSSALASVVSPKAVQEMPLNGRDFRQMLKLSPGVTPGGAVNGNRASANNFQIDGADNNDAFHNSAAVNQGGVAGIAGTLLPIEAIDQFAIVSNASAEQGRNGGSNVNLVIKSGTNALHGSAYYFNRNEALAAHTPFQAPTDPKRKVRDNQSGFSIGGPILRNKLFYFATGEAQSGVAGLSLRSTHPSSAYVDQARAVLQRFGISESPIAIPVLSAWPARYNTLPAAANNLLSVDNSTFNSYNGIVKLDYLITPKHTIAVRYFGGTGQQAADNGVPYREYFQVVPSRMHNVSVVLNSVVTSRITNQLTLGTNYFLQVFNDADASFNPVAAGLNTGVTDPLLAGTPTLRITNFAGAGATQPTGRIDTTGHLTDNLNYTFGRHQMKFGAEYRRAVLDVFYNTNKRGSFTWDGTRGPWASATDISPALKSLADFLAMLPSNSTGATIVRGDLQRLYLQNSIDWYVHDNWQLTQRLNINFGVRYTYQGVLHDDKNSITTFIPGKGIVTPGSGGVDGLYPKDLNNFAPRVGLAYQPTRDGKTVVRASWGMFYDVPALNFFVANTGFPNGAAAGVQANPGGASPVYSISLANQNVQILPGVPIFGNAQPTPPFGAFGISQDFRTPYIQNYNFDIQRSLGGSSVLQIAYVGSTGRKLTGFRDVNAPIPGTTGTLQSRRPYNTLFPDLAAINMIFSASNSQYHSLQTSIRVMNWKHLLVNGNYTWSRAIDDNGDPRNTLPANSYDLTRERGPSSIDLTHIFTAYASYEVPGSSRWKLITKGWQFNSLLTLTSGSPIDILAGTNRSQSFDSRDRVDVVGNAGVGLQDPATPYGPRAYFNTAAFALPAIGSFGNIGRNALRGPGFEAVDFSVFKNTPITERLSSQLRIELFNIFNHTNFANPGTSLNSATTFGLITNTRNGSSAPGIGAGEPFNAQLALKLIW